MELEEMSRFFTARVNEYDEHMLGEVEGCREGYEKMAALLPKTVQRLLDLGCGTAKNLEFRRMLFTISIPPARRKIRFVC